ncbi:MAG: exodeoxyribonuclease VII large subunit [Lachnospiraceae bacterium]|nr:exodeoxyribonuclease VII large subunit [Lachnospiraceae bacterium]
MEQTYRVSQVNAYVRNLLEGDRLLSHITVEGEVSNCKYHPSGHVYFSLKEADAQLPCVMFSSARARGLSFAMRDGMQVTATGRVSLYDRDGRCQLYVTLIRPAGQGLLYEELERRKRALYEEGLFDVAHKKALPEYPRRIGIVTAEKGAALQDILQILRRRNPYIQPVLSPCQVQGEGAAASVCRALRRVAQANVDVIIVGRGGGSIEDLWAFNEECVARAVYACEIPVISAVGHEINTTLIDFVADVVAPTPSAAAELVSGTSEELEARLIDLHAGLYRSMAAAVEKARAEVEALSVRLRYVSPGNRLARDREALAAAGERMVWLVRRALTDERTALDLHGERLRRGMRERVRQARADLGVLAARLDGVSPVKTLSKGYAYVTTESGPVSGVSSLKPGCEIRGYVSDGGFTALVKTVRKNEVTDDGRD